MWILAIGLISPQMQPKLHGIQPRTAGKRAWD
jgi:hypothetical protein